MKKVISVACTCIALLVLAESAFAQMEAIAKLDVLAIRKMQFVESGNDLIGKNTVVFSNGGATEVKLRNAIFKVSLKSPAGIVPMGEAALAELLFPAAVEGQAAELTTEMDVIVGPKNDETIQRLIALFNVIGDPATPFTMMLDGTAEVGIRTEKGWIYQKGLAVELEFQPSIQREVLFK